MTAVPTMVATVSIKMDELLVSWLGSDTIYENVLRIIESQKEEAANNNRAASPKDGTAEANNEDGADSNNDGKPPMSPKLEKKTRPEIPPFFRKQDHSTNNANANNAASNDTSVDNPQNPPPALPKRRFHSSFTKNQTWDGIYMTNPDGNCDNNKNNNNNNNNTTNNNNNTKSTYMHKFDRDSIATDSSLVSTALGSAADTTTANAANNKEPCIAPKAKELYQELGVTAGQHRMLAEQEGGQLSPQYGNLQSTLLHYLDCAGKQYHKDEEDCCFVPIEKFERITKELCNLPTFFHKPLYERILRLWENHL